MCGYGVGVYIYILWMDGLDGWMDGNQGMFEYVVPFGLVFREEKVGLDITLSYRGWAVRTGIRINFFLILGAFMVVVVGMVFGCGERHHHHNPSLGSGFS